MAKSVFFSWQSDSPAKIGKKFLEDILTEVCKGISEDTSVNEAQRDEVVLDSDTKDVAGQPPIFQTILEKIDGTDVFFADLTAVGERKKGKGLIANPNVLIEFGYATKTLNNPKRIIYIMNTAYGEPGEHGENLPFDLRHSRYPITYHLEDTAKSEDIAKERSKLLSLLSRAVRGSLTAALGNVALTDIAVFPEQPTLNGPSRFRAAGEEIGIKDDSWGFSATEDPEKVFVPEGPAMWLRVMPTKPRSKPIRNVDLKKIVEGTTSRFTTLISRGGGYDYVRAQDGMGLYLAGAGERDEKRHTVSTPRLAFIFATGEIWTIDTSVLQYQKKLIPSFETIYKDTLVIYRDLLRAQGIEGPYKWIAGMTGLKGRNIAMPEPPPGRQYIESVGPTCIAETIQAEGKFDFEDTPEDVLRPFFEDIYDKCNMERPQHLG